MFSRILITLLMTGLSLPIHAQFTAAKPPSLIVEYGQCVKRGTLLLLASRTCESLEKQPIQKSEFDKVVEACSSRVAKRELRAGTPHQVIVKNQKILPALAKKWFETNINERYKACGIQTVFSINANKGP